MLVLLFGAYTPLSNDQLTQQSPAVATEGFKSNLRWHKAASRMVFKWSWQLSPLVSEAETCDASCVDTELRRGVFYLHTWTDMYILQKSYSERHLFAPHLFKVRKSMNSCTGFQAGYI